MVLNTQKTPLFLKSGVGHLPFCFSLFKEVLTISILDCFTLKTAEHKILFRTKRRYMVFSFCG